jgi:Ca2+-binding EF-hand superfamily protein
MQKPVPIRNFEDIKAETLKICTARSSNGLRGLRILFKVIDRNKNGSVDPVEFKYAMRDFGLELSEIEVS